LQKHGGTDTLVGQERNEESLQELKVETLDKKL